MWLRGIGLYGAKDGSKFTVNIKVIFWADVKSNFESLRHIFILVLKTLCDLDINS